VAGDRTPDGSGAILLFESDDALRWRYAGTLAASGNRHGRMWECPDFFRLDGKHVLLTSPQEMKAEGLEFIYGNTTLCLIGAFDRERCRLLREHTQTIDYGLDFYAPQTVETADGRRVMIAWMQYWNSVDVRPREDLPFFGQMTMPRELRVRDGRLIQNPVRELMAYRGARVSRIDVPVSGGLTLPGVSGRCLDMTAEIRPGADGAYRAFTIHVAEGGGFDTSIRYEPARGTVLVDRSRSGFPPEIQNTREFAVRDLGGCIRLRILLDRYSLELFVNDGEQAAAFTLFAPEDADGIRFEADGEARMDIDKYDLVF
jgi:beta-fructofuranosidase